MKSIDYDHNSKPNLCWSLLANPGIPGSANGKGGLIATWLAIEAVRFRGSVTALPLR